VNERSGNRHFQRPHSHLTPPLQRTPENICINLIHVLPETTFPGLHFCRWQTMGCSANFRTLFFESGNANPLAAEPETDFNAKWPFKVIYFGIIEEPLRGYIVQYNKCGLRCEGSEDIASERRENRHFRPPNSHLALLLQRTPSKIRIKLSLLETRIPWLHFFADSKGVSSCKF